MHSLNTDLPRPREVVVAVQNASFGYAVRTVLKDVTLSIATGEIWAIAGPNGAGKSTLLKGLIGMLPPLGGERICRGLLLRSYVPQECSAVSTLPTTIEEFVRMGLVRTNVGRSEGRHRLEAVLRSCGLSSLAGVQYATCSGGQRRRALIARALVREPRLLALDEPTVGLDPEGVEELRDLLLHLKPTVAIVLVTHDVAFVENIATHLAVVSEGTVRVR